MWNLCRAFEELSDTWLAQAKAVDVELYEMTRHLPKRKASPLLVEESIEVSLLKGLNELMQQLVGWAAANTPKGTKKPQVKRLPRPETARQIMARVEARRAYEHVEAALVYVPADESTTTHGGG